MKNLFNKLFFVATLLTLYNCSDDDNGRAGAMEMLKDEPEWMNENLFPWERELQIGGGVMSIGKPESCSQ